MTDEHQNFRISSTSGIAIAISWVFMAIHMEETMHKRTTWRPRKFTSIKMFFSIVTTDVSRQDVRRTWEVL